MTFQPSGVVLINLDQPVNFRVGLAFASDGEVTRDLVNLGAVDQLGGKVRSLWICHWFRSRSRYDR